MNKNLERKKVIDKFIRYYKLIIPTYMKYDDRRSFFDIFG